MCCDFFFLNLFIFNKFEPLTLFKHFWNNFLIPLKLFALFNLW